MVHKVGHCTGREELLVLFVDKWLLLAVEETSQRWWCGGGDGRGWNDYCTAQPSWVSSRNQ